MHVRSVPACLATFLRPIVCWEHQAQVTTRPPAALDVVALLIGADAHGLVRGQVGTVVEWLTEDHLEVEFSDDEGRTYAQLAVRRDSLLVLQYGPARARPAISVRSELPSSEIGSPYQP